MPGKPVGRRQLRTHRRRPALIADLRHRLQVAVATHRWAPLARAHLLADPGLDAEASSRLEFLVPPSSRWSIGLVALYTAVAPDRSIAD
jgi:hypothetical protein